MDAEQTNASIDSRFSPAARSFLEETTMKSIFGISDAALDAVMALAYQLYQLGRYAEAEVSLPRPHRRRPQVLVVDSPSCGDVAPPRPPSRSARRAREGSRLRAHRAEAALHARRDPRGAREAGELSGRATDVHHQPAARASRPTKPKGEHHGLQHRKRLLRDQVRGTDRSRSVKRPTASFPAT